MSDDITVMFFDKEEFLDGMNMTVRRGAHYDSVRGSVYLQGLDQESPGSVGDIINTKVMRFEDIQKEDLSFCTKGTDYETVMEVMKEVYDDFDVYEIVTLVYFKVVE